MKKRALLLILTLIGFVSIDCALANPIQIGASGTYYEYDSASKTLTITGNGAMPNFVYYSHEPGNGGSNAPWDAFKTEIIHLIINDGVTVIGENAFYNCTNLEFVSIPGSVTNINEYSFYGCSKIQNITIPEGVKNIGNNVFFDCISLESITLPSTLKNLGEWVFGFCSSLKTIDIPAGVEVVREGLFSFCSNLKSVGLHEGLKTLGDYVFAHCPKLDSIDIPAGVTSVGTYAFQNCSGLKIVTSQSVTPPVIGANAFRGANALTTIYVPFGAEESYKAVSGWKDFNIVGDDILVSVNVTGISLFPNKSATLVAGSTLKFIATVLPENATNKKLTWTSSDDAIATVDSLGKVTAQAAGLATITVTTNDGGKTASVEISVFGIAVSSVALDKTADTIPIGSSVQLTATVNPSYATDKTVKWTSSNEAVASVDSTGKVYGIAVGVATIVVETSNGKTDTCVITVYRPVNDVTIELPLVGEESIIISLELPAGGFVTGSFVLALPEGLLIDLDNTSVSESLSENLQLIVTPLGNNTWLIELAAALQTYSMRLSSASMFREILNIAYKVDKKMVPGSYEVSVSDVNLMLSDGTKIKKDKLATNVIISGTTSNEFIGAAKATLINSILTVDTPDAETINVYSVSGSMVYTAAKVEGKSVYSVSNLPNGIYVVTGSKGWQAKVLKR